MLPAVYLITGVTPGDDEAWLRTLEGALGAGARLVQMRRHDLDDDGYAALAARALALCRQAGALLLLNRDPELARRLGADGVHLTAARLAACRERPLPPPFLVAASCHDTEDLRRAAAVEADFAVLSPVLPTASHPGASTLGWERFAALAAAALLPVYALGGVGPDDLDTARRHGGHGIAGISAFWPGKKRQDAGHAPRHPSAE